MSITWYTQLKEEALFYSEEYGYPISNDAVTGIPNRQGNGDKRDAFRHVYASAVSTYETSSYMNYIGGELVELAGRNAADLASMDRKSNALGRDIGDRISKKYEDNPGISEQQIKDEIAHEANEVVELGIADYFVGRDNDDYYVAPGEYIVPGESNFFDWDSYEFITPLMDKNGLLDTSESDDEEGSDPFGGLPGYGYSGLTDFYI